MSTEVADRPREPRPPRIGPLIAVALELGMVSVFIFDRAWVGLALALGYAWFSATWALLAGVFDRDRR
jgi:hypothetical protein